MTHGPRDRVEIIRDGVHVVWCRKAVSIANAAQDGPLAVRGTLSALSAAGVWIGDDGRATVEHAGESIAVGAIVSPVSLAPRASGKSESTAPRKRPKRALTLSPAAWAWLDAQAGEGGVSAVVERMVDACRLLLRVGRPARIVSFVGAVRRPGRKRPPP